jgi:hypothetical protein
VIPGAPSVRLAALLALVLLADAAQVSAAPPTGQPSAVDLFRDGKRAYEAGDYAAACTLLAQSDGLDPTVGTLGLMAACEEKRGRLATALLAYREVVARARKVSDAREDFAQKRVAALEPRVPRVIVQAPASVEVSVAGDVVTDRGPGSPILVDPGSVEIAARYADGTTWARELQVEEGTQAVVVIPESTRAAEPAAVAPMEPSGGGVHPLVLVTAGGGIAGLAVMTGFGVAAIAQNGRSDELEDACGRGDSAACAEGPGVRDAASTSAAVATIAFAAGTACLAASVVLWAVLDEPGASESAGGSTGIGVGPGDVGIRVVRSF